MFNQTLNSRTDVHTTINVEQANVHDAARLLREMEQSIISKIPLDNNKFKGTLVLCQGMVGQYLQFVFVLNDTRISVPSEPFYDERSLQEALGGLTKAASTKIVEEILSGAFNDLPKETYRMLLFRS